MSDIESKLASIVNPTMADCTRCVASRAQQCIIDVIHPNTGRTFIYGKTVAECREEYPDAESETVEAFCAWKAEQQRTPIQWMQTTAEQYDEMLGVLPPAAYAGAAFLVGEPTDHDAGNGQPRFPAYRKRGAAYEVASRPVTIPEFRAEGVTI